jgi:hypothetical protein
MGWMCVQTPPPAPATDQPDGKEDGSDTKEDTEED